MLRTAQSLPLQGLLTLGFDPTRFPVEPPACYRASWQLPGPDSRRRATTSLSLSVHPKGLTSNCLGARKIEASLSRGPPTQLGERRLCTRWRVHERLFETQDTKRRMSRHHITFRRPFPPYAGVLLQLRSRRADP